MKKEEMMLKATQMLAKGKFKLKGNLLAAVAHLGVYQSLIDSKKAVDWDYGM